MKNYGLELEDQVFKNLCFSSIAHDITLNDHLATIKSTYDEAYSKLSEQEKKQVLSHPEDAIHLLKRFPSFNDNIRDIIKFHHEKPAGKGFPKGIFISQQSVSVCTFSLIHEIADLLIENGINLYSISKLRVHINSKYSEGNFEKPLGVFNK